jgi:hypothetical protein
MEKEKQKKTVLTWKHEVKMIYNILSQHRSWHLVGACHGNIEEIAVSLSSTKQGKKD